ncbi:glycoside hydrolase superfamily [Podospora aff. communis PSN243]|uniref:Glycoside hydrolase superfamily n=1 Tax=Podospora aff. communis PSN243 TaxID=3040156 RepID=A0AAV9GVR6_9PEZI|nr:glycoside hydrolase superfamily [Podospora aff. communis PSN243]
MRLLTPLIATTVLAVDLSPRQASTQTLTINPSWKFQTIDGFGFSEAFQRAYNILNLDEPKRSKLIDLLFNTTSGAGFSILRNGIGSSPNSTKDWMNTILPKGPANPSEEPEYVWDNNDSGQLWVSQQAVKYGVKTFYANAWAAQGFMKTNGRDSHGGTLCGLPGTNCTTGDWRQAYADYLVQYIKFYHESGVDVTHLGFVNEPDYTANYASMTATGAQAADFIKVLHATLRASNLSQVHITCCEATGWNVQANLTHDLRFEGVEHLLGVITSHPYTHDIDGSLPTTLPVWQTEYSDLMGSWSTNWYTTGHLGDGFKWANNLHYALTAGNVTGYLWWLATQDKETNNNNNEKLILVDQGEYYVSKRFWAFAQYSRTIRPGAVRVWIEGGNGLKTTAFVNVDGSTVVNVINIGAEAVVFEVKGVKATTANAWLTDESNDMTSVATTVGADGSVGGINVPGRGLVSLVIRPSAA